MISGMEAIYFASAQELHDWLDQHHGDTAEVLVGFYKVDSGRAGLTYAQALDEALCFGWIDGVRKRVDAERYTIRFTPRKPGSVWSAVNLRRAAELEAAGRLQPAGLRAYHERAPQKVQQYSYENRPQDLPEEYQEQFRANPTAWEFFSAQPPSYRRTATWFVVSAKQEETRQRRLAQVIEAAAQGKRLAQLTSGSQAT